MYSIVNNLHIVTKAKNNTKICQMSSNHPNENIQFYLMDRSIKYGTSKPKPPSA